VNLSMTAPQDPVSIGRVPHGELVEPTHRRSQARSPGAGGSTAPPAKHWAIDIH
jgi:hypothetical protein